MNKLLSRLTQKDTVVGLDTMFFIYQFQAHPDISPITATILKHIETNHITAVTSIISLLETTSLSALKQYPDLIASYHNFFTQTPNLTLRDLSLPISSKAATLRRIYHFSTPDSIQLATAIQSEAQYFLTNDTQLKQCQEISVIMLQDLIENK